MPSDAVGEFQTSDPLADLKAARPRATTATPASPRSPAASSATPATTPPATSRPRSSPPPRDDRRLPDLLFGLYNELVIFDHVDKTIKVVANARWPGNEWPVVSQWPVKKKTGHSSASSSSTDHSPLTTGHSSPATDHYEQAYRDACRRTDEIVARALQQPPASKLGEIDARAPAHAAVREQLHPRRVRRRRPPRSRYIKAGDIFQFVPGQRLRSMPSPADPFDVYRALRIINPSPFMFYLKSPQCTLIGSSPEILCRVEGRG